MASVTVSATPCAGFRSFGPNDSLSTAEMRVENTDLRVRVSANGPDVRLRLEPAAYPEPESNAVHTVGWIRVFSCESGGLLQSLQVGSSDNPKRFLQSFEVKDVNFDGYLDISVIREGGAKWVRQTWWMFSPALGRFVSDAFSKQLGEVSHNGLELDSARQNVTARHLTDLSGCGPTKDIYHVEGGGLLLIHQEAISFPGGAPGCTLTTSDRMNGRLRIKKIQHFPPYRAG
jgi:hypothetical protein